MAAMATLAVGIWSGRAVASDEAAPNSCGCYRDVMGMCLCNTKARCGCPGECEPRGCEEKRTKLLDKEIEAETKKAAADSARRQRETSSAKEKEDDSAEDISAAESSAPTKDKDEAAQPRTAHVHKLKVPRMTAAQKKEFHRLLDLYLTVHPDQERRTLEQASNELQGTETAHNP